MPCHKHPRLWACKALVKAKEFEKHLVSPLFWGGKGEAIKSFKAVFEIPLQNCRTLVAVAQLKRTLPFMALQPSISLLLEELPFSF